MGLGGRIDFKKKLCTVRPDSRTKDLTLPHPSFPTPPHLQKDTNRSMQETEISPSMQETEINSFARNQSLASSFSAGVISCISAADNHANACSEDNFVSPQKSSQVLF